jgi:hypothetical protein
VRYTKGFLQFQDFYISILVVQDIKINNHHSPGKAIIAFVENGSTAIFDKCVFIRMNLFDLGPKDLYKYRLDER